MALSLAQGAQRISKWGDNLADEVPRHSVKAVATRFKKQTEALMPYRTFKNFGGTGKSNVGAGVHFKVTGRGGGAVALVSTYGPFDVLETGAARHVILPKAGRGTTRSGRTRTRRGAESQVRRRLEKGKGFRSLEGGSVTAQHALKIGSGRHSKSGFQPYAHHPGTKPHHPWQRGVAIIGPQAVILFEKSTRIGMLKVGLG